MAEVTVLKRRLSSYGNEKREMGEFVYSTAADTQLQTKLGNVRWFKVVAVDTASAGAQKHFFAYNSNTTSANQGKPGMVNLNGDQGTHSLVNLKTYCYEAIGY